MPVRLFFFVLIFLFAACDTQQPNAYALEQDAAYSLENARYAPADLQKMNWLAGLWQWTEQGVVHTQSFTFLPDNQLKIVADTRNGTIQTQEICWQEGHFYFGNQRAWKITWIGEKDVRLEPITPDFEPITWTRLNENTWHLIRHTDSGDQVTVMTRIGSIPS